MKKNIGIFRIIGIIITVLLTFIAWYFGVFQIIFYILGFYAALYFISIIFRTTAIIDTVLGGGIFLFYIWTAIWSLWLLYISLNTMFTESFFLGIILLIVVLPIAEMILYGIAIGLGFVLGYPLIWFSEDLEKRFGEKEELVSDKYINNENEILDYEDLEKERKEESLEEKLDLLYDDALKVVNKEGIASPALLQRKLKIGYADASRLIDELEENEIIGPADGAKPRKVYIKENDTIIE